jgi:Ca2+-binding RTX toxin-like protein
VANIPNLVGNGAGSDDRFSGAHDQVRTDSAPIDRRIGALTGAPKYHPLLVGSLAINRIPEASCIFASGSDNSLFSDSAPISADQAGTVRPQNSNCDIGAAEEIGGGANTPPVANDDSYSVAAGESLSVGSGEGVLANDRDTDGHSLDAIWLTDPAHGNLDLDDDGSFFYVPAAGFSGEDRFTYAANDGFADSNVATVRITVNAPVPASTCDGHAATIYVANGSVVGGPLDGQPYAGRLRGSGGADVIVGTAERDEIDTGQGDDLVCGGGGNDAIDGDEGHDMILGQEGVDMLRGGAGADYFNGGAGTDQVMDFTSREGDTKDNTIRQDSFSRTVDDGRSTVW